MRKQHSVSLLCSDLNNLERDINIFNTSGLDLLHFDVMDGIFVPGFGLSEKHLKLIRKITSLPIEVHLMTIEPDNQIDLFAEQRANIISVHVEACSNLPRTIKKIKNKCAAGVVINPLTSIETAKYVIPEVDIITLMSINPGLIGADFLPIVIPKIHELKELIDTICSNDSRPLIQIDGSLNENFTKQIFNAGADIAVHGEKSFLRNKHNLKEAIERTLFEINH